MEFNSISCKTLCSNFPAILPKTNPNIRIIIRNYPPDIINQFFTKFLDEYDDVRTYTISQPKTKKIIDNIEYLIRKLRLNLIKSLKSKK